MYIATKGMTVIATAESYSDLISQLANSRGDKIEAVEARHYDAFVSCLAWEMYVNGKKWPPSCTNANDPYIAEHGYTKDEAMDYFLECYAKKLPYTIYNATKIE